MADTPRDKAQTASQNAPKTPAKTVPQGGGRNLEQALGYRFRTPELLTRALTHSSFAGDGMTAPRPPCQPETDDGKSPQHVPLSALSWNYERLEFLGDRVLGLVIAEALLAQFPKAAEGELARRFNQLVRKETCAKIARNIDLGDFIIMSQAERASGGQMKKTILGDACEALLGAVFLDGGFNSAREMILRLWSQLLAAPDLVQTDAKSALQEWAQGRALPIPHYVEVERSGPDHNPSFKLEVRVRNMPPEQGSGKSKRAAQQAAARAFLIREGIWKKKTDG